MDIESIMNILAWFVLLTLFAYANREIEIWRIMREIERYLSLYKKVRDKALDTTLKHFKEVAEKTKSMLDERELEGRVLNMVESVFIEPEAKDPYGIIAKLKHIVITGDETATREIKHLLPSAEESDVENLKNLIGATRLLNMIYKVVDHYYRLGRKFKSLWLLLQLQSLLPVLTEEVKALENSVEAFIHGFPIGDSAGPLLAARFIEKYGGTATLEEIAKNTILAQVNYKNRSVYVIKAKGPGGVTGHLDDAVEELIVHRKIPVKMILTVDAALKLEGEKSGMIVDGIGVAIGGLGIEKFNIEKIAVENKIPLYAVLIKMSEIEALSIMSKEVAEAIDRALKRVEQIIEERSNEGDSIILVGVGNTVGVYP